MNKQALSVRTFSLLVPTKCSQIVFPHVTQILLASNELCFHAYITNLVFYSSQFQKKFLELFFPQETNV